MPNGGSSWQKQELAYKELCASYRAIDDFRTKLLGFLPLASGAGLLLLTGGPDAQKPLGTYAAAIAAFGFAVTLGLLVFEVFGIAKCAALISTGRDLEWELRIEEVGPFTQLPPPILWLVNEPLASGLVYSAVLAAWAYVALVDRPDRAVIAGALFAAAVVAVFALELWLRGREEARAEQRKQRRAERAAREGPVPVESGAPGLGQAG